ncbi:hypothetical protein [Oceanobacter mangrovi]|uniref:hypothetical protein n=1 Tax=Oceanobacter mangrovi TaxID=2862510 RepID=UPI001C8D18E7|nr:hypothetical protein [Oceanobacter mangrovi]
MNPVKLPISLPLIAIMLSAALSGCGAGEESRQIYPASVTYQTIEASVAADVLEVSEVSFASQQDIRVSWQRVTISDGTQTTSASADDDESGFSDDHVYQLEGDYSALISTDGLTLSVTTNTELWHNLTSTATITALPVFVSPNSGESFNSGETITLQWTTPANADITELRLCPYATSLYSSITPDYKAIELAVGTTSYSISVDDLLTRVNGNCYPQPTLVATTQGQIADEFAGGNFEVSLQGEPLQLTINQTQE